MNGKFSQIHKLFVTGLCICLLIGNILIPSNSALALSSPLTNVKRPQQVLWGDTCVCFLGRGLMFW